MIAFFIPALVMGAVFSAVAAFVGIRLMDRGAVLPVLTIAQCAAIGTAVAILTSHDRASIVSVAWSLAVALPASVVIARFHRHRDTATAILFVVAAAASIIVLSFAAEMSDNIQLMLTGDIVSISLHQILYIALVLAVVAIFLMIVGDLPEAFLFGVTAVVCSLSVSILGVLVAFSYLIVPSVAATLFSQSFGKRLAIGWTMGALMTALGIALSLLVDLPTGATIVSTFGLTLLIMAGVRILTRKRAAV